VTSRVTVLSALTPYIQRARAFTGWDHSSLKMRSLGGELPWNYEAVATKYASRAGRVLDVGTGGGERFATIAAGSAATFVATEEWGVNARVAYDRLCPAGIALVWASSMRLPFSDSAFELFLSRHEAIEPAECNRVLAPGGRFLTQQCAPDDWRELRRFFPRMTVHPQHDRLYPEAFRDMGYEVSFQRNDYEVAFGTLGDLVFMLMTAPWTIPDFDPQLELDALMAVEAELSRPEGIVLSEGRYLLDARKPG
jgi:SAM-dependent methyltransferase